MPLTSTNPATGETIKTYEEITDSELENALARSHDTFLRHRKHGFDKRTERMQAAADILEAETEDFAQLMTAEMGKPIAQARAEIGKCAAACRFYAENAEEMLRDEKRASDKEGSFIRYLPIGPVLAVMPWNFPFWQVFRFAAPNLMGGNTGILKHASNVSGCALAIADIFKRAGFEDGAFQTILTSSGRIERILRDDRVRAATLTGSEKAGAAVAKIAGEEIKKTVLELGGSDAFIVMPSADIDKAVEVGVTARIQNNGQSCIAAKRFIVHADIYDQYRDKYVERMSALKVGDPTDENNDIGPLVNTDAVETLARQVDETVSAGGKRATGAKPLDRTGAFFEPGVLENIPKDSPAYTDELFGPVALMFKVGSLDEAITLANDHRYGLGSSFWSSDKAEIEQAINTLDAGATFVNQMVASAQSLPFGGAKKSGYGRELASEGLKEFLNTKTVAIS